MSDQSPEAPYEHRKWVWELQKRDAERAHDAISANIDKVNEATVNSGQLALRTAILVNGGAAVAMLAFISSISVGRDFEEIGQLTSSLTWFAVGVAFAGAAMAFTYFTNISMAREAGSFELLAEYPFSRETDATRRYRRASNVFRVLSWVTGLLSLVFFVLGMCDVRYSIMQLGAQ